MKKIAEWVCITLIYIVVFIAAYSLVIKFYIANEQKEQKERMERQKIIERINTELFGEYPLIKKGLTAGPILTFYWKPKENQIMATTLPFNKFLFIIDNSRKAPTVKFIFSKTAKIDIYNYYARHKSEPPNLNDWVQKLIRAEIKISSSDLEL